MSDPLQPILLVDDEPEIVTMFREVLKRDYCVYTATNGAEALDILREKTEIQAVIADHMMPKMTGVELLQAAYDIQPHTARVLVTASQEVEHLRDAINLARVHRFVSKPVRLAELRAVVSGALREASLESENTSLVDELQEKNRLLNRALSRVQNHERELEREVANRTKELQEANEKLRELALRDGLTGVYNHRFFQESLSSELARAARHQHSVGLLFIDVDYFKNFNDMAGHQAGDALLRQLGKMLSNAGDDPDYRYGGRCSDITARYGGEEFVIILPETNKENSIVRAERVRMMIEEYPFEMREVQPEKKVTASIGVSIYPDDALTKQALIKVADEALYIAKRNGRNQVQVAKPTGKSPEQASSTTPSS
uniref:diguanylate cyclase n=1 Tax=uncultured myxobacterium HF0200_19H16 TaxID=723559 RepID=E7C3V1_9BACT|nr:FOG: GGDEF domain [uncultured myxobacterium HF0200_19H16]